MAFQQYPSKGGIPSGNTAGRPSSPVIGDTYYNGQLEILEIYNGTQWVANSAPPATPTIVSVTDTGGAIAYATGGTLTVVVAAGSGGATPLQYNVVTDVGGYSASSSGTTVTLSGLTPGSYTVSANASNNFGTTVNSSPSSSVSASTVPQAPTIGTTTLSGGYPVVNWTLNSNGGKALSAITITPYLNGTTAQTSRTAATTSSTSYTFTAGQLTEDASYTFKVKTTNANGTSLESAASNSVTVDAFFNIDFLVVAGGGAGANGATVSSNRAGGGGGGGGMRSSVANTGGSIGTLETAVSASLATNYTVTVGAGASAQGPQNQGANGSNSVFSSITSLGGGGGATAGITANGSNGGSGGGGSQGGSGGSGTSNQGYAGSNSTGGNNAGGGGGAGSTSGSETGGNGRSNDLTGSTYSAGGNYITAAGSQVNGGANTGRGGSGGYNDEGTAGSGGSGIVILKYPDTRTITIGAGLTGSTSSPSGGFKISTITAGSGNVSFA